MYTGNIVASGGVSSNEDIRVWPHGAVRGIVGKAYYAGTVDLAQAVRDAGRQD